MRCADCLQGTSAAACAACREMQAEGDWRWEIDNGQRMIRCPDCDFGLLIGYYVYKNPYRYCPGCGRLNLKQRQMAMEI